MAFALTDLGAGLLSSAASGTYSSGTLLRQTSAASQSVGSELLKKWAEANSQNLITSALNTGNYERALRLTESIPTLKQGQSISNISSLFPLLLIGAVVLMVTKWK